jgi:CheY-like chemotaxis protein
MNGSRIRIEVNDTGVGLDPRGEMQLRQFLSSSKLNASEVIENKQTFGLGLTISNLLAQKLGSKGIEFSSEFQKGSRFYFEFAPHVKTDDLEPYHVSETFTRLPDKIVFPSLCFDHPKGQRDLLRARSGTMALRQKTREMKSDYRIMVSRVDDQISPTPGRALSAENSIVLPECNCKRILLVDDDNFNLTSLATQMRLVNSDFECVKATNGQEAIDILVRHPRCSDACKPFHAILMDVNMPIKDGLEATKEITAMIAAQTLPNIPIIACSANAVQSVITSMMQAGCVYYCPKPLNLKKLREVLANYGVVDGSMSPS